MIYTIICNYNALSHMKKCLESVDVYSTDSNNQIYVIDNKSTDGSINYLLNDFKTINSFFNLVYRDNNEGKAKAINYVVKEYIGDYLKDDDLIFSLDSDITLLSSDFINKINKYWNILKDHVSCIVCNQMGNSLTKRKLNWQDSNKGFNYFIPNEGYGCGIAGGAIITSYKNWKIVNGYRENNGLYGGNDGNLMLDLYNKTKKPVCVIKELEVFHPEEDNEDYQQWKDDAHKQQMKYGKCIESKGFYD